MDYLMIACGVPVLTIGILMSGYWIYLKIRNKE